VRLVARMLGAALAGALVWFAVAGPDTVADLTGPGLVALPLDGVLLVALLSWGSRSWARRATPGRTRALLTVVGVYLGVVSLLRLLDVGFGWVLDRPFDPLSDWAYVGSARGLVADASSPVIAVLGLVGASAVVLGLLVVLPWAMRRLFRVAIHHPTGGRMAAVALAVGWVVCAAAGLQVAPDRPVATAGAVGVAARHVALARDELRDRTAFDRGLAADGMRGVPDDQLLAGLRGKDVLVVFVESYGQVALEGPPQVASTVDAALQDASARLGTLGWSSRSAWLTSPTFGGISWLAHSTLGSGLWVNSQGRYDRLLSSDRLTLSGAFHRAGWRTVGVVPANQHDWPEGVRFYRYDALYDSRTLGYAGPRFGYATVPDQFTLKAFQDRELADPQHQPVMAEIDLVSSHLPWTPLPRLLDWEHLGDGSAYTQVRAQALATGAGGGGRGGVKTAYGNSIAYSLGSLVSFVQESHDDNLVLVVLGDHQPASVVSGRGASHDVPVTVIAHDPAVTARVGEQWGWPEGLSPRAGAPVWRMDAFRNRFLTTFGPGQAP
jgi:hypothetical protein